MRLSPPGRAQHFHLQRDTTSWTDEDAPCERREVPLQLISCVQVPIILVACGVSDEPMELHHTSVEI
jgi:hypothetical protein